ncbi:MAG: VTT domain-containing protein [Parcubacteria group bacterium]|nr:VTT domain-containing protein [Parcubacteria group bacterium]
MAAYIFFTIIAVVFAPVSTLPLIPLATSVWGWFIAGMLSIVGWTIGAQIAFYIARYFGKPLVKKLISFDKLNKFENYFPKQNTFWAVVFFRMVIPVDVLSYALGLFSRMNGFSYFLATLIGVAPFAFILAYAGTLSVGFQIAALGAGFMMIFIGYSVKKITLAILIL